MKKFLSLLESVITILLVVAGIAGLSYRTFRDDGWLAKGFEKITDAYITYPLMAIAATVALAFAVRSWLARRSLGKRGVHFDYIIYVFVAAGIYFIGHYFLKGEL